MSSIRNLFRGLHPLRAFFVIGYALLCAGCGDEDLLSGTTEVMKWKDGRAGAISITYDDATINQFRQALPIMDTLGLKGTFFINTAHIRDSGIPAQFVGRSIRDIVKETALESTHESNLFERASALRFTGLPGAVEYHNNAGSLFENEKFEEAYAVIDEAYAKVRRAGLKVKPMSRPAPENMVTWEEIRAFAARGHEFGSHTISHPRLAVLDEANLLYEMEKCKEEIGRELGDDHTFSAECPFGTENERVMEYAYKIHPALRNRMPEPFLEEINRWNDMTPGMSDKPYVQWQRGPLTATPLALMKSWVDSLLLHDHVWLVLTFHGVDGIGWEAKPHEELAAYFRYMKQHGSQLWIAPFRDVTKYMRERMAADVKVEKNDDRITVNVTHGLDRALYNFPLTLKTYVRDGAAGVTMEQDGRKETLKTFRDDKGTYVLYEAIPHAGVITLSDAGA